MKANHIIVHGRVQGVSFRWFVQRAGSRFGLTGDVRNLSDGTVEIFVEGDEHAIREFVAEVERGPSMSRVERLEVYEVPAGGRYPSFLLEGR